MNNKSKSKSHSFEDSRLMSDHIHNGNNKVLGKTANSPLFDRNTVVMLLGALIVVIWGYVALITFDSPRAVLFAIGCSLPLAYWLMTFADDFLGGDL